MRSSVIAALCAAPLALAGNLQHDLAGRGIITPELAERSSELVINKKEITIVQAKSEEIIIIWTNDGNGAATKTVTETKTVGQVAGATAAAAQTTHTVVVGGAAGKVYTPESVNAAVGDMIVFNFEMANHTLTQSAFTSPCEKLATGGMDSGFIPNIKNAISPPPAMAIQVMVDTPQCQYTTEIIQSQKILIQLQGFTVVKLATAVQEWFSVSIRLLIKLKHSSRQWPWHKMALEVRVPFKEEPLLALPVAEPLQVLLLQLALQLLPRQLLLGLEQLALMEHAHVVAFVDKLRSQMLLYKELECLVGFLVSISLLMVIHSHYLNLTTM